jgi:hypothetical protein
MFQVLCEAFARSTSRFRKDHRRMNKLLTAFCLLMTAHSIFAAPPPAPDWKTKVAETMPLLGHRNWILIVDSAYPLQTSPGVETIETNADHLEVVRYVLDSIGNSIHVSPLIYMDAELPFVPDQDAPGASAYRAQVGDLLKGNPVESVPHAKLIANIDDAGKVFHILVLKTNLTIPYTSVFIRLDCKYWTSEDEKHMRAKMTETRQPVH